MRILRGKTPFIILLSFAIITAVLFVSLRYSAFIGPVRNLVFDAYQVIKPRQVENSAVVIIDIDEASINEVGQWPWPRSILAEMTIKLAEAGAMAIAFDMVFSEADRTNPALLAKRLPENTESRDVVISALSGLPDTDNEFAKAIGAAPTVLGFFDLGRKNTGKVRKIAGVSWLGEDMTSLLNKVHGNIGSMELFQKAARGQGSISIGTSQQDDIVRSIGLFNDSNGDVFPSLSIEALRVAIQNATGELQSFLIKTSQSGTEGAAGWAITEARVANFEFPLTETGAFNIYYALNEQTTYLPAKDAIARTSAELSDLLAGKIVLIGTSAPGLRDIRTTTLREAVPGVAIHAQVLDQIMEAEFLNRPDWALGAEVLLAIILTLAILLALPYLGAVSSAAFGALCAVIVLATSWFAFDWYGILFDPAVPLLTALCAYVMTTVLLFAFAEREKRFVRSAFQHYLAPNLLTKLEDDPSALKLGGEIRDMTLMFLDVRDFTPISEKLDPQELVTFLNDLLSPLSDIIQKHEGAIDKYIGNSIMAFWNAPLDVDNHPQKACRAALEMLDKVAELNARDAFGFAERGLDPVAIGIGINTGDGCVGNMGSSTRFDYSVVGDTVNVAARLEAASKDARWPILVSAQTARQADNLALLNAGEIPLKGKTEPQEVYALVGDHQMAASAEFEKLRTAHNALLSALKTRTVRHRKRLLENCLALAPRGLHEFISGK